MSDPLPMRHLDDKGRCCGRKPLVYRRPLHQFCPRCCADYNMAGQQIPNWAWLETPGGFVARNPGQDYDVLARDAVARP